jgi:XTP/dITP diphosphohydrolase
MRVLIATTNRHKIEEIRAIFRIPTLELLSPRDAGVSAEVEEDGDTFEANAIKKATTLARVSGLWTMADDSGLEVESLGGEPGVRSARYAGEPVNYEANNRKLLLAMPTGAGRRARFRCAIALSSPDARARVVEGECRGTIAPAPRGTGGFGYDPLFIPDGYTQTFGEMAQDLKNSLSHRGAALRKAASTWADIFRDGGTGQA